jgi:hypothetical protein
VHPYTLGIEEGCTMPILHKISDLLYRLSSVWTALGATLIYGFFIATVMPAQSADSASYAGDWGSPDRHLFYTPDELYASITTWGDAGRDDYISFRLGLDILWALAYTGFLVGWISCALRYAFAETDWRRLLNLWPLITLCSDYAENALGILLVANYSTRLDFFALLATSTSALKWVSLVIAHGILIYALGKAVQKKLQNRS